MAREDELVTLAQAEAALLKFYRGLWRAHPREMTWLYVTKLRSTGNEVFQSAANIAAQYYVPRVIGETLYKVTNGFVLFLLAAAAFAFALWKCVRGNSARSLINSLVSLAVIASLIEGFVTYSIFVGIYYSSLLYAVFFGSLVLLQLAVDYLGARVRAVWIGGHSQAASLGTHS